MYVAACYIEKTQQEDISIQSDNNTELSSWL